LEPQSTLGIAHFIRQTDAVGMTLLVILLGMSVVTWYLIVVRALQAVRTRAETRRFLEVFWSAPSVQAVTAHLAKHRARDPFARLAEHAITSVRHHRRHAASTLADGGTLNEFLTRSIRRVIDEETARSEHGLTMLASIGSTAPFIGLFGTVWGVYHALVTIGMSGQGTLDKVAGPVGEALIMTALGLAVAVPAVLAYNFSVRRNRLFLGRLDSFAHDLFALLTTGSAVGDDEAEAPAESPAASNIAPAGA
jgi:biopolymer transport protein ExbB